MSLHRISDDDRALDTLTKVGLPLGRKALELGVFRSDSMPSWLAGCAMVCSACSKVVGYYGLDMEGLLDPNAGWVLERRRSLGTMFLCGVPEETCSHCGATNCGCQVRINWDYPLACSDACEVKLLSDGRFEYCEPPFGYQRGGPHP